MNRVLVAFGWNSSILSSKGRNSFSLSVSRIKEHEICNDWRFGSCWFIQASLIWTRVTTVFEKNTHFCPWLVIYVGLGIFISHGGIWTSSRMVKGSCIFQLLLWKFTQVWMLECMNSSKASLRLGKSTWQEFVFRNQFLKKPLKCSLRTSPCAQGCSSHWSVMWAMLPQP